MPGNSFVMITSPREFHMQVFLIQMHWKRRKTYRSLRNKTVSPTDALTATNPMISAATRA
jgi:hypothetical protein